MHIGSRPYRADQDINDVFFNILILKKVSDVIGTSTRQSPHNECFSEEILPLTHNTFTQQGQFSSSYYMNTSTMVQTLKWI